MKTHRSWYRPMLSQNAPLGRFVAALLLVVTMVVAGLIAPKLSAQSPEEAVVQDESVVRTQEELQSAEVIFQGERYAADIEKLKRSYRGELESYRTAERQYQLAKVQSKKLGTLVALEESVKATQQVMRARGQVLRSYLDILRLSLLDAPGINLTQKQEAIAELEEVQRLLVVHLELLEPTHDKVLSARVSEDFVELEKRLRDTSHKTLSLLKIGALQNAYDKTVILTAEMKIQVATGGGALKEAERQRGFDENQRALDKTRADLDAAIAISQEGRSQQNYQGVYRRVTDALGAVYTDLSQVLSFLEELLRI